MGYFHVVKDGLLVSHGYAQDGCEQLQAGSGQTVVIGAVPGYAKEAPPHRGARWHVEDQRWIDTRTEKELRQHESEAIDAARRAAYPPLADFADAMYWQAQGDNGPMLVWQAACAKVKADFPKPERVTSNK